MPPVFNELTKKELYAIRSAATLVQQIENLTYHQRLREMVCVGRAAAEPMGEHLVAVLCNLALSDDVYQRLLSATGLKEYLKHFKGEMVAMEVTQAVEALMKDTSQLVYKRAASTAARLFRSCDAVRLIGVLTLPQTKYLCSDMLKEKKQSLLDEAFKQPAVINNACRRSAVGSFISESLATSLSSEVFLGLSRITHAALFSRFPAAMAAKIDMVLQTESKGGSGMEAGAVPVALQPVIEVAVRVLHRTSQARVGWELARRFLHRLAMTPDRRLNLLLPYVVPFTEETCNYILQHPDIGEAYPCRGYCSKSLSAQARLNIFKLPIDVQVGLVVCNFISLEHFRLFPPALRRTLYLEHRDMLVDKDTGYVSDNFLGYLPTDELRQREAKKIVEDAKVDQGIRIRALKVFDVKHIQAVAKDFIENPDVNIRMECLEAIVESVQYHSETLGDVLDYCVRRKNEQDPYRSTLFYGLAQLPPSVWEADHLPRVEVLVKTMLTAKDLSEKSAGNAFDVLIRIAWKHPEFAVNKLDAILRWSADAHSQNVNVPLETAKRLLPTVMVHAERNNFDNFYPLMRFLPEPQLKKLTQDVEPLLKKALKSKKLHVAEEAMRLYKQYLPAQALSMLPEMLNSRPDWIFAAPVREMLSSELQGPILTKFVHPLKNIQGPLLPRNQKDDVTHYVEFPRRHMYRWTSKQQRTYTKSLIEKVSKPNFGRWRLAERVSVIGSLPSATLDDGLREVVAADFEPAYLHAVVMGVLGNMNDRASLKELCVAITEEGPNSRARDAVRPLVTRLRRMSLEQALPMLELVLNAKSITVQKEAVIALGSYGSEAAFDRLQKFEADKGDNLHKDVRVALMQAYWNFLWKPEVWAVFEEMASGSRSAAAIRVMDIPAELLTSSWQSENFNGLVLTLLGHVDNTVVDAALNRLLTPQKVEDARWYPAIYNLLEREKERMAGKACEVLLVLRVNVEELTQSVSVLASDAAVKMFIDHLKNHGNGVASPDSRETKIAHSLAVKLINSRRQPTLASRCMMMCRPDAWLELLEMMKSTGLLHRGVQMSVLSELSALHTKSSSKFGTALIEAEKHLFRHYEDPFFRHIGLTSLSCFESWSPEARLALLAYQADEDRWVRDDAKLVVPPREV